MRFPADTSRFRGILICVCALVLGACASTDKIPKVVRTATVDFQDSFSDMVFKALPPEEQVRLEFSGDDPIFSFEGGSSHYEALALPDLAQPYVLRIDSEVVKNRLGYNGTLFFPVPTFLDADKKWIKTFDALPYVTQKPLGKTNYITVSLQVSDELAAARYVVIHTQEDKLNMAIGYYDGEVLMKSRNFNTMMTAPVDDPRYRYEFSPQGWVRLKAFKLSEVSKTPSSNN